MLLILYCLHCAVPTDLLLYRRLWNEPPIGLNTKCVSTSPEVDKGKTKEQWAKVLSHAIRVKKYVVYVKADFSSR